MSDDEFRDLVLEHLHRAPDAFRSLVRDMARDHPDRLARELEAALHSAARDMDAAVRRDGAPTDQARTARRLALLLGMDIDRLADDVTLGALAAHWRDNDDFFLRL